MVSPRGESRSDLEIVFDLACRLGMNEAFFDGNIEAAWNYQLEPLGLTVEMLRNKPEGYDIPLEHKVRKYAFRDPNSGYLAGFNTETKRAEFYSEIFIAMVTILYLSMYSRKNTSATILIIH
jgi:anaerobic selenocysteine-containing dehydrogenase